MFDLKDVLDDLLRRLKNPSQFSVAGRLTSAILDISAAKSPMKLNAETFNLSAETYYRSTLKTNHVLEGLNFLHEDLSSLDSNQAFLKQDYREAIRYVVKDRDTRKFLEDISEDVLSESVPLDIIEKLIDLIVITIHSDADEPFKNIRRIEIHDNDEPPVCGERNWENQDGKTIGDKAIQFLYSSARERAPFLFRAVTSARFSSELLSFFKFDMGLGLPQEIH